MKGYLAALYAGTMLLILGLTPEQHNEKCIQEFCMYLNNCCFFIDILNEWADDPFFVDLYEASLKSNEKER